MKLCLLLIGLIGIAEGAPDCSKSYRFSNRGDAALNPSQEFIGQVPNAAGSFDNRVAGCNAWYLAYDSEGFSALSISLEDAPATSTGSGTFITFAGTTVAGSNPQTSTSGGGYSATGYYPYIRVNLSSVTGTGSINVSLNGWKSPNMLASLGGGSSGKTVVSCGGVDDTTLIQAAMDSYGTVEITSETCVVSNLISTKAVSIKGYGTASILSMKSGATGIMLDSTGYALQINNLVLDGGLSSSQQATTSAGNRSGVQFDVAARNNMLVNSIARGFSNIAIGFKGTSSLRDETPVVSSCFMYWNFISIQNRIGASGTAGEYIKIVGNSINESRSGIIDYAGNTNIVGNTITDNGYGVQILADANDGHGSLVGNSINHHTVNSINISSIINGFQIVGNNIWYGNITVDNSIGVNISNNIIGSVSTITFSNADSNCRFAANTFKGSNPTLAVGYVGVTVIDNQQVDGSYFVNSASFPVTPNLTPTTFGSNLITNGGFTSGTGWTTSGGASISGNAAHLGTGLVYQNISTVSLGIYAITFTISGTGTFQFGIGGAQTSTTYNLSAGTYTEYLQVTKANDTNFYMVGITTGTNITTLSVLPTLPSATSLSSLQFPISSGVIFSSGSNGRSGSGTLSGGTLAVTNTSVTANSKIFVQNTGGGVLANIGSLYIASQTAGTGFTVTSSNALDTSNFNYWIFELI